MYYLHKYHTENEFVRQDEQFIVLTLKSNTIYFKSKFRFYHKSYINYLCNVDNRVYRTDWFNDQLDMKPDDFLNYSVRIAFDKHINSTTGFIIIKE